MICRYHRDIQRLSHNTPEHTDTEFGMHVNDIQMHITYFITGRKVIRCRKLVTVQPLQFHAWQP